ncbi:hypothetical protein CRUP_037887, partial [Coryphaenoides rupestris]
MSDSCVYTLPKNNVDTSDAGTYYCALAACGGIVFGSGTKLVVTGAQSASNHVTHDSVTQEQQGQLYSCQCAEGFQGRDCDRRRPPPACRGQRCGHGECRVSETGEPVCHRQAGYTGPTCDT